MLVIELLYFDGCPNWSAAWTELGTALGDLGLEAEVRLRNVADMRPDELAGFAGSPTVRIDGRDLEGYQGPPVMACRRYLGNRGEGWPERALLRRRLRDAAEHLAGPGGAAG